MKKLIDIFSTNPFDGPFNKLYSRHADLTFLNGKVRSLDAQYILNHSGEKPLSPAAYRLVYGDTLILDPQAELVDMAYEMYSQKWTDIWNAFAAEYNPIENYSMTEKVIEDKTTTTFGKTIDDDTEVRYGKKIDDDDETTFGKTVGDTLDTTFGKTVGDTLDTTFGKNNTKSGSESVEEEFTPRVETTTAESVNAFNAAAASPKSSTVESKTGKDDKDTTTTFNNVKDQEGGTQKDERSIEEGGTQKDERSIEEGGTEKHERDYAESGKDNTERDYREGGTEINDREYEFTRSGNIGVTTSQQMIESEWELRQKNFFDMMMKDLDSVYCLPCY